MPTKKTTARATAKPAAKAAAARAPQKNSAAAVTTGRSVAAKPAAPKQTGSKQAAPKQTASKSAATQPRTAKATPNQASTKASPNKALSNKALSNKALSSKTGANTGKRATPKAAAKTAATTPHKPVVKAILTKPTLPGATGKTLTATAPSIRVATAVTAAEPFKKPEKRPSTAVVSRSAPDENQYTVEDPGFLDSSEVHDETDQAQWQQLREMAAIQARARALAAPENHPDFDGQHCVDCDCAIPPGRLKLGKVRCVDCQGDLEKSSQRHGNTSINREPANTAAWGGDVPDDWKN